MRRRLEDSQARRLQPHYVQAFFLTAFTKLGGRITAREAGRYEITHVPGDVRDRDRQIGTGAAVLARYERVTFQRDLVRVPGNPRADLLAPGHQLLDAVVDLTIERHRSTLKQGSVLIDRADPGETPRLLFALIQQITDGHTPPGTVSKTVRLHRTDARRTSSRGRPGPPTSTTNRPARTTAQYSEPLSKIHGLLAAQRMSRLAGRSSTRCPSTAARWTTESCRWSPEPGSRSGAG